MTCRPSIIRHDTYIYLLKGTVYEMRYYQMFIKLQENTDHFSILGWF
jgi:hypothetical protein